jgi:histone deacetylase 1/2
MANLLKIIINDSGVSEKKRNNNNSLKTCFVCGKRGHIASQCFHRKGGDERNNENNKVKHHAGYAFTLFPIEKPKQQYIENNGYELDGEDDLMINSLFVCSEKFIALNANFRNLNLKEKNYAIIDSGATNLYVKNVNLLSNPKFIESSVTTAGGESLKIEAVGTLTLNIGNAQVSIKNSYFCPSFIHNLFSVSKLQEVGIKVEFPAHTNTCVLSLGNEHSTIAKNDYGLYLFDLDFQLHLNIANFAEVDRNVLLDYHFKFGHASYQVMKTMLDSMNIPFENKVLEDLCRNCEICIKCKAVSRYLIFRPEKRSTKIGECVNVDEVGPIKPVSIHGYTYFSLAKDDYCGFTIVAFEKNRGKVIYKLMNFWITMLKKYNHLDNFVKVRSDGAKAIASYVLNAGLKHYVCLPGVSQENGRAEREVRALSTLTRILLNQSNLPKFLWPEAVAHACFIRNRLYSKTYDGIPFELFTKEKVDLSRLIVFGSKCTVHALKIDRNGKWDLPSLEGYFVGYQDDDQHQLGSSQAIKVFIPPRKVLVRNLIRVHENEFYQSKDHYSSGVIPIQVVDNEIELKSDLIESISDILEEIKVKQVQFNEEVQIINEQETEENHLEDDDYTRRDTEQKVMEEQCDPPTEIESVERRLEQTEIESVERRVEQNEESKIEVQSNSESIASSKPSRGSKPRGFYKWPDYKEYFVGLSMLFPHEDNPLTSHQAHNGPYGEQWIESEIAELKNFEAKNVFTWIHKSETNGEPILPIKIVYKKKFDSEGNIKQFKTRITVQGQRESSENMSTHAGTIYFCLILMLLCLAAMMELDLIFCDVESAYLNAPTNRDVYVRPTEFAYNYFKKSKDYVWKLNKALYGLKDSARLWKEYLDEKLRSIGFESSKKDSCLYFKFSNDGEFSFLGIHVDDLTIVSSSKQFREKVVDKLKSLFNIKCNFSNVLGINIKRSTSGIEISMRNYVENMLRRYKCENLNPCKTPMEQNITVDDYELEDTTSNKEIIGSLLHLARFARFDLLFSVHYASLRPNMAILKRILRYVCGTKSHSFSFQYISPKAKPTLIAFTDAEWSRDMDAKSTGGYFITLMDGNQEIEYNRNIFNAPISVSSKKQRLVTDSSSYAEFVQIYLATKEIVFLREILKELKFEQIEPTVIFVDNAACLQVAYSERTGKNRSKHWNSKFMYVCECVENGIIELRHVPTEENIADIFTKPLPLQKYSYFCNKMNLKGDDVQLREGVADAGYVVTPN